MYVCVHVYVCVCNGGGGVWPVLTSGVRGWKSMVGDPDSPVYDGLQFAHE